MRVHISRALIGFVFIINVQSALAFIIFPGNYAPSFEISGDIGESVIRSLGVLFLMWNVPYGVALWNPVRFRISLYEAVGMQSIGLLGETLIYAALPVSYVLARSSIMRFVLFDALGLLALLAAVWISRSEKDG